MLQMSENSMKEYLCKNLSDLGEFGLLRLSQYKVVTHSAAKFLSQRFRIRITNMGRTSENRQFSLDKKARKMWHHTDLSQLLRLPPLMQAGLCKPTSVSVKWSNHINPMGYLYGLNEIMVVKVLGPGPSTCKILISPVLQMGKMKTSTPNIAKCCMIFSDP